MEPFALQTFWGLSATELLRSLYSSEEGLSQAESTRRLADHGANLIRAGKRHSAFFLLLGQFKSPIILTLFFIREGKVRETLVGLTTKNKLAALVDRNLPG